MRRRIRGAIVGVSAIILIALGVPLAVVVHRYVLDSEVVELQAAAATTLAEIDVPIESAQLRTIGAEPDTPDRFGVYAPSGARIYGAGPRQGDEAVRKALTGRSASTSQDEIVVATPIVETGSERLRGVLRVEESLAGADHRSRIAWLVMGLAGVAAVGLAWIIGNRLARTLSEPLSDLAAGATGTHEVGLHEPRPVSGIAEIDSLAGVLSERARKVNEALMRERRFSADVSHQLRTPITALRLKLERTLSVRRDEDVSAALADLDRLEDTIEHLLAIARDAIPTAGEIQLDAAVGSAVERWQPRAAESGRSVIELPCGPTTVKANRASIDQVVDVLIDNALRHGQGDVTVALRHMAGGVAVDVIDEGSAVAPLDAERIFNRGHGSGNGIGLSVARSIAEVEGGRLLLSGHRPTSFSLLLLEQAASPASG